MKLTLFAIRHQHCGVVADTVYATEPTARQVDEAKAIHDRRSGREGWARPHPIVLDTAGLPAELEAALAAVLQPAEEPGPADHAAGGSLPITRVRGVATLEP